MNIEQAIIEIEKQKDLPKYEAMINTAAIITKLLEDQNIKPIIVGGLSVEIYTQNEYATRDVDFVSDGYENIGKLLFQLGFKKDGRHFYHSYIEIAIEIPDNYLAGDYHKVVKVDIDEDKYVYLISIEDIIIDRLRGAVYWQSYEDNIWGFKLLSGNIDSVDFDYLFSTLETEKEKDKLNEWIVTLTGDKIIK